MPRTFWDPLSAWPRARKPAWALLAILIGAAQGPDFVRRLYPPADRGVDFFQDWASARNLLEGQPVYARHDQALRRYLNVQDAGAVQILIPYNAHPPTSVLLAVPFALLDYRPAALAWNLASLVALGVSLWLLARGLEVPLRWWSVFPAVCLLLLSGPFRMQMLQGQLNGVLLLLLVGVWYAERRGGARTAGALLALATAVKLYPGLFLVYYTLRRRRGLVVAALVWLGVLLAASVALVGWDDCRSYLDIVLPSVRGYQGSWRNLSAAGFFSKLFDPEIGREAVRLTPLVRAPLVARLLGYATAVGIGVVWVLALRRAPAPPRADQAFALTLVTMLLVSPISWDHYLVLLLIPLAFIWATEPLQGSRGAGFLVVLLLTNAPVYDLFYPQETGPLRLDPVDAVTVLSIPTYGLVALFVFLWTSLGQASAKFHGA